MPKRVDANQPEIVQALRDIGATVQHLHEVGKGCPDILVGYRHNNWAFEIKTKTGRMTPDETDWHSLWNGQVTVIRSAGEAVDIVTGYDSPADVPPF